MADRGTCAQLPEIISSLLAVTEGIIFYKWTLNAALGANLRCRHLNTHRKWDKEPEPATSGACSSPAAENCWGPSRVNPDLSPLTPKPLWNLLTLFQLPERWSWLIPGTPNPTSALTALQSKHWASLPQPEDQKHQSPNSSTNEAQNALERDI